MRRQKSENRQTRYIGALDSRRSHAKCVVRLQQADLGAEQIARNRAPIGLQRVAQATKDIAPVAAAHIMSDRRSTLQFTPI
jgi:xanthine/CO dehydrogenase XdhC/CoxF family maturation factor